MFIPSSMTWTWPSSGLSGRPTFAAEIVKFWTATSTGISVVVILSPAFGETTVSEPLVVGALGLDLAAALAAGLAVALADAAGLADTDAAAGAEAAALAATED